MKTDNLALVRNFDSSCLLQLGVVGLKQLVQASICENLGHGDGGKHNTVSSPFISVGKWQNPIFEAGLDT